VYTKHRSLPVKTFGATIREAREQQGITLRKFAEQVGISPTFVSKMERDEFDPPKEENIRKMATILSIDADVLLGLAGKVASDLPKIVQNRPQLMATFLRKAGKLSSENIEKLLKQMEKMK
jgi:transcriptional regulator with XRE-family HTH domain